MHDRLPLARLLALALAGFITLMTKVMPAGLLPQIGAGLGTTKAMAGQFVTACALGAVITAIPLMMMTQILGRRAVLVGYAARMVPPHLAGRAIAVTAITHNVLYTFIAPSLVPSGLAGRVVVVLLGGFGTSIFPWAMLAMIVPAFAIAARRLP